MKKLTLLLVALAITTSPVDAKISFKTFMLKGLLPAIKESNEKNKLKNAINEIDGFAYEEENSDPDDIMNFLIDMDNSQYQWSQSKSKKNQALLSNAGLTITNKVSNTLFASTIELPIVVESDNFTFGFVTPAEKLNDKKGLALIFDYQDDHTFKTIIIDGSQYRYVVYNGGIANMVKTGLVKYTKGAFLNVFYIKREGSVIHFYLNDVEYGEFKNVEITNAVFGAGVFGKTSTTILKMILNIETPDDNIEQHTTLN